MPIDEQSPVASIAIVDDDETFAILLAYNIEALGFATRWIRRGIDAVPICAAELPRAVVLDWSLAGVSGRSVLQAMRAHPKTRGLPVLAITDGTDPRDVPLAIASGADCCLCKPFPLPGFLQEIAMLAGRPHGTEGRGVIAAKYPADRKSMPMHPDADRNAFDRGQQPR
ncbi:MAG: response regulator transcription factor [Hyphomicrobiaceae bacterium]|nr:MAG: response regulator transcription factor [Hyphomicrobiaceae bacterium]